MTTPTGEKKFPLGDLTKKNRSDSCKSDTEHDFEDSYNDDRLEDLLVHEDDRFSSGEYFRDDILDESSYVDCDADLEKVLTNGNAVLTPEDIERLIISKPGSSNSKHRRFLKFLRIKRNSFYDAAEEVGYDTTPDSGVHESLQNMDPEQRAKLEEEWRNELAKTEEEIQTLRQVLASHLKRSQDLKRKLGITVWKEFYEDVEQGLKNVKESTAYKSANDKFSEIHQAVTAAPLYQKTNLALKSATEKTSSAFGNIGANVSKKLGDVKNSTAFKSFEEKVGSAYENVKMSGSRSNSMQNFEEVLEGAGNQKPGGATPATTPSIPEEKPLS